MANYQKELPPLPDSCSVQSAHFASKSPFESQNPPRKWDSSVDESEHNGGRDDASQNSSHSSRYVPIYDRLDDWFGGRMDLK